MALHVAATTEFPAYAASPLDRDVWALLTLSVPQQQVRAAVGVRVLVMLDCSGSMHEDHKLTLAKRVVLRLLEVAAVPDNQLYVGLATFDDEAHLVLPVALRTTPETLTDAKDAVECLEAGAGTNLEAALRLAAQLVQEQQEQQQQSSPAMPTMVLLLTDGQPQMGLCIGTPAEQQALIRVWTDAGAPATLFTMGLGADHKAAFLGALATAGHGTYTHVAKAKWIGRELGAVLGQAAAQLTDHTGVLVELPCAREVGAAYSTLPLKVGDTPGLQFRVPVMARGQELAIPVRLGGLGPLPAMLRWTARYTTLDGIAIVSHGALRIEAAAATAAGETADAAPCHADPVLVMHRLRYRVASLLAQDDPTLPALHALLTEVKAAAAATATEPEQTVLYADLRRQLEAALEGIERGEREVERMGRHAHSMSLHMQSGALLFGHSMSASARDMSQQLDVPLDHAESDSLAPHGGKLRRTRSCLPLAAPEPRLDLDQEEIQESQAY